MLRFHEIAEAQHRILNPFTEEKLMLLGEICRLQPGMTQLDLCCGKAEMLCRWAQRYRITGIGVDISPVFLAAAQARATELAVAEQLTLIEGDAAQYHIDQRFDIVSCIGATWIGNGLLGTLDLMKPMLKPNGLLLVGEPYWIEPPPIEAYAALGINEADYVSLDKTLDRIESAGCQLVEMVLADGDSWDRYAAAQWWTMQQWLNTHPHHADAPALRDWWQTGQRSYLQYNRRYLGWGVFALREG
jgi:SAM-dependent methyltransferase